MNNTDYYSRRNAAIDILRALTMFTMIFVNDFWKVHDIPAWLDHAKRGEDFMGLADVVFPAFLFAVGMSIPFAVENRFAKGYSGQSTIGHILSRTLALLVMGAFITNSEARLSADVPYPIGVYWFLMAAAFICLWNRYPKGDTRLKRIICISLKFLGVAVLVFLAVGFRSAKGNVFNASWGILGSIGWTYLLCAMIYVFTRSRLKYLVSLWIIFIIICILGSKMNTAHGGEALLSLPRPNFYNEVLGILHIGNGALPAFTMGGIILSILSVRYREISIGKRLAWAAVISASLLIAGIVARNFWILSKLSATPTWIAYVTAITVAAYALIRLATENGKASWFDFIKPAGTATLTTYLVPYVSYGLADVTGVVLPDLFTHGFMSIVNCLCFSLAIIWATWLLGKMYIALKI